MDLTIADWAIAPALLQQGLVNGAIYGLIALALIIVFTVTRIILLPIGEFAILAALTLSGFEAGARPMTLWLLAGLAAAAAATRLWRAGQPGGKRHLARDLTVTIGAATIAIGLGEAALQTNPPQFLRAILALLVILPMGPYLYDLVYRPLANATLMSLLIVSVALHLALMGLCFMLLGAGGLRTTNLAETSLRLGSLHIGGQSIVILLTAAMLLLAVFLFFRHSLLGKALRATAMSRTGARLVAIPADLCGHLALSLAAGIGALGGILLSGVSTVYYDTGFLITLKGFIAALIGGVASYPLAALGALGIGVAESLSALSWVEHQEILILFALVPVLLWRSWRMRRDAEESEP